MSALDQFIDEWADERIAELQRLIDTQPPYQPQPGDADYQTPESIEWVRLGHADSDDRSTD